MAQDEALADRVRALLAASDVTEKRMFGGLAFLLRGHMAVAVGGQGGLMVRVDPADSERLVRGTPAERMVMRGRPMQGWLRLDTDELDDDAVLQEWVDRGAQFTLTLPPKS